MEHVSIQILRLKYLKHFVQIHLEISYFFFLKQNLPNQFKRVSIF